MVTLAELGFKYFPLTHSGVPEIVKESRPVGFEEELAQLLDIVNYFVNTHLNENLLVVVVGEYGWGKTELLDYFVHTVREKFRDKVEIARVPLTFNLSVKHIVDILKKRSDKPLILIVDEADELARVFAVEGVHSNQDVVKLVTELGTVIRAIIEPRHYGEVLGVPQSKLRQILLVVAFTPHLYFNVLKNLVPDVFDVAIGRVYREIVIRQETPLWLYHALLVEKMCAASSQKRLQEIKRGKLDPIYPLKFEYIASLYYILHLSERGFPSPRTLIKYTAKLLDKVLEKGVLDLETYISFLKDIAQEVPLVSRVLERVEKIAELHEDSTTRTARLLLELCPIPLTLDFLKQELGERAEHVVRGLVESGIAEEVLIVPVDPASRDTINLINRIRVELGLPEVVFEDIRKLSIELDSYYTRYEHKPVLYVVLPPQAESKLPPQVRAIRGVKLCARAVLKLNEESTPEVKIVELVRYAYSLISRPRELASRLAEVILRRVKHSAQLAENVLVFCTSEEFEARQCLVFAHVQSEDQLESVLKRVEDVIRNGYVSTRYGEIPFDILYVVLYAPALTISDAVTRALLEQEWKVPGLSTSALCRVIVFDSSRLDKLRHVLAGFLIVSAGLTPPQRFAYLVEAYEEFRRDLETFLNSARAVIVRNLCLSVKKARDSKANIIRKIVEAWIRNEKIYDQPEVFRQPDGTPVLTFAERAFLEYLRRRGLTKLTAREAERIVRLLFPVNLWRELRERDFLELCKLRGILLEEGQHYLVYSPETAREYVIRRLKLLKELHSRLCTEVTLELTDKIKLRVCEENGEDVAQLRSLEQKITSLVDLGFDEESLRRLAAVLRDLEDLEQRFVQQARRLSEYVSKISSIVSKLREHVDYVRSRISTLRELGLSSIPSMLESKLRESIDTVKILLSTCDVITSEQLYDTLSRVADLVNNVSMSVDAVITLVDKLLTLEKSYAKLEPAVRVVTRVLQDVDLMAKLGLVQSSDKLISLLEECHKVLSSRISEKLSKLYEEVNRAKLVLQWVCSKERLSRLLKSCAEVDNLDSLSLDRLRKLMSDVVSELSAKTGIEPEHIVKLGLVRGQLTVEDVAERLGVDVETARVILDKLCELGLVKKLYVLE